MDKSFWFERSYEFFKVLLLLLLHDFTACFLINEGISNFDIQEKLKSYLADRSIKKI